MPTLLVIPGTIRRAHNYDALAAALGPTYTVHILERRGRGNALPQGADYSIDQEVDDALTLLDRTGATQVFGHSYGGLIALHLALRRDLERLIAYEPAVSIDGSLAFDFLPEFERLLSRGRPGAALAEFLTRLQFLPARIPRPIRTGIAALLIRTRTEGREIREVLPTIPNEGRVAIGLDSDGSRYAAVNTPTLLLGGGRSPAYNREILPKLEAIMPLAKTVITPEFDHNAPDLGDPAKVAALIRA